jgi:tRNA(adenine34) deaminase
MFDEQDHYWMGHALELAAYAASIGEVPVGAVLVNDQGLIAQGWNCPIAKHDPSAHAEMEAIRKAGMQMQNYRLINTTLYVTLEPCLMCAGALVHARIKRLVFAAYDAKAGVIESICHWLDHPALNHRIQYQGGLMHEPCALVLSNFFRAKRAR